MFDCVLPTRSGRNGQAFTSEGTLNLRNARFAEDTGPLDPACGCPACTRFSRAYLHHVVKAGEIIAAILLTWHNLKFYQDLMQELRNAISESRIEGSAARYGRPENPA
jgi:queuine tRNA-ribosyltransferase